MAAEPALRPPLSPLPPPLPLPPPPSPGRRAAPGHGESIGRHPPPHRELSPRRGLAWPFRQQGRAGGPRVQLPRPPLAEALRPAGRLTARGGASRARQSCPPPASLTVLSLPVVSQDVQDQALPGQEAEAEPAHPAVDSHENGQ